MGRKPRVWYPHAMYHITSRGNRKEPLFHDNLDRHKYFYFLEETRKRYPFFLHSYCLMTNHIHLQLETITDPIHLIMKSINMNYAKYFNQRYDFVGHVFEKRYGAELISNQKYEIDVSKYIHLNPVEAELVKLPELYLWSSYRSYVFNEHNPYITTEKILSYFASPSATTYKQFVESDELELDPSKFLRIPSSHVK